MENISLSGAIQGDLKDASKKKLQTPGNQARASAMQAQYQQPVIGPRTGVTPANTPPKNTSIGLDDILQGAGNLPVSAARDFANNIGTDIRNVAASAVDGKQVPRPGYPHTQAAYEQMKRGGDRFAQANMSLGTNAKPAMRETLGLEVDPRAVQQPVTAANTPANGYTSAEFDQWAQGQTAQPTVTQESPVISGAQQSTPQDGFVDTGLGQGLQGGSIAARRGAGGVMEFSNDAKVQAGAGAMPAGGVGGIGDGIGTFSQGQAGDSKLALDRFDRANAIRAQTIQDGRRGVVGEGGGRLTVVADSSRSPTTQDLQHARLNERVAQTAALGKRDAREDQQLALNVNRDNRESAAAGIEMQTAQMGLDSGLRIEEIRQQLSDPAIKGDQRAALERNYASLTTSAKDRYVLQDAVIGADAYGPKYGKIALDVVTGQPVGQGQAAPETARKTATSAEVDAAAKQAGKSRAEILQVMKDKGITING
ncbi:hypothetical protein [Pseudomonas anguilliseptica]|uniref:Uncharacterized protein n=1 Tax=Pseudomonas anguilliseptica TaxID=53406 RepID=A0A1H5FAE1_PSEAG|nr:hypothetical protein [Pseudomonas anguilliseptica]SEE00283.1 hypothetical protein SAMN05421553_3818 [Pseudomonas anguilliseptica]